MSCPLVRAFHKKISSDSVRLLAGPVAVGRVPVLRIEPPHHHHENLVGKRLGGHSVEAGWTNHAAEKAVFEYEVEFAAKVAVVIFHALKGAKMLIRRLRDSPQSRPRPKRQTLRNDLDIHDGYSPVGSAGVYKQNEQNKAAILH